MGWERRRGYDKRDNWKEEKSIMGVRLWREAGEGRRSGADGVIGRNRNINNRKNIVSMLVQRDECHGKVRAGRAWQRRAGRVVGSERGAWRGRMGRGGIGGVRGGGI